MASPVSSGNNETIPFVEWIRILKKRTREQELFKEIVEKCFEGQAPWKSAPSFEGLWDGRQLEEVAPSEKWEYLQNVVQILKEPNKKYRKEAFRKVFKSEWEELNALALQISDYLKYPF